jgi:hypothetical protein
MPRLTTLVTSLTAFLAVFPLVIQGCSASSEPTNGSSGELSTSSHGRPNNVMHMRSPSANAAVVPESAPSGAHLTYNGGRVVGGIQVITVIWGAGSYESHVTSTGTPSMMSFYNQVVSNGSYTTWLDSEYNTVNNSFNGTKTNQHITAGSATSVVTITPSSSSTTVDDSTIQSELAAQIAAGHLPAPVADSAGNNETYYAVFFPHGVTITQGGSSSCVGGGFCAYHGTVAAASGHGEFYYGVHPDMQAGSGCDTGCGSAATAFGNYTSVASHELTETITDAEVGLAGNGSGPPLAWYDNANGEIGDICNAQQGTYHACDGQTYTIQLEFSNAQNNCIAYNAPTCGGTTNDFSISDAPSSLSITAGSSATSTISTAVAAGSAGSVALSVTGATTGITATLAASSVTAGNSTTLTVAVASGTAAGTHTLTITGVEGSKTHTATVSVTVTAAAANDFSIADNPTSIGVTAGASGTSTISTALVSGSAQSIALSATGAPTGATVSFSPASVTTGASSVLTIATSASTAAGSYAITISGTNGATTHTATLALTVTSTSGGGGLVNGGFETGNLTGWTASGASETVVSSGCHGGTYCAQLGATTPTNGDSTVAQTFTAPAGATGISLWYKMTCPDTVTYDWAVATLKDNTAGTTATLITKICTTNSWTNVTGALTAGHGYTLTLTSHDDNYAADPSYTLYDDVTITSTPVSSGITNGGFESGLSGWTASGASETAVTTGCHSGSGCARLGTTTPTNGDSSVTQTFTVPSGKTQVSLWYKMTCPDTVTYDWATVTLKNNSTGTTTTLLAKTCATDSAYVNVTGAVTAGTSYTITLTSHDDNYAADPSYTLYDDVTLN